MRILITAILPILTIALAACVTDRPRSAYDMGSREYRDGSGSFCEQYAYETGRNRYELMSTITGRAFALSGAEAAAERAFQRCRAGRTN